MVSATNSSPREVVKPAELTARIAEYGRPVWVLAMQTDAFARLAWQDGKPAAATLERRSLERFAELRLELLRKGDVLVHARGDDVFAFALLGAPRRAAGPSVDRRRALARIERDVHARAGIDVVSSWTLVRPGEDAPGAILGAAERAGACRQRRAFASLLHDLATPMSSIYGSLGAILDGVLDAPTERRFLQTAHAEAARASRLLRSFLAAQTVEAHVLTACEALERAVAAAEPLARERRVRVRIAASAKRLSLTLDDDRTIALMLGLIENAIKHGRAQGRVEAQLRRERTTCVLTVDDDGPGVAPGSALDIFDFGERAGAPGGFGIGLAHARLLVEAHGGDIAVARAPLGGARFTVRLPLANALP